MGSGDRNSYAKQENPKDALTTMEGNFYDPRLWMIDPRRMILLVEDDDADAELASRAFQRAKVITPLVRVRDGVEALDYFFARGKHARRDARDLPVFVLLDLNIPKISGLKVLEAIRADDRTRHLPVIILTSSGEEKDRLAAYKHFANSYVVKPIDYDQFVSALQQICRYWTELNAAAPLLPSSSYDLT